MDQRPKSNNRSTKSTRNSNRSTKNKLNRLSDLTDDISESLKLLSNSDDVGENLNVLKRITLFINSATGFSTIPDIMKALVSFHDQFKRLYDRKSNDQVKIVLADIISYISTAHPANSTDGEVLKYYLLGSKNLINIWGISYVRNLTKDIVDTCKKGPIKDENYRKILINLINECSRFYFKQNSELEACDLLIETEQMNLLESLVTSLELCEKICDYILACSAYLPEPENKNVLYTALSLCLENKLFIKSLFVALHLQEMNIVEKIFLLCPEQVVRQQMALIMARHNIPLTNMVQSSFECDIGETLSNNRLNHHFILVATHLDCMQPKAPNDIINKDYKFRHRRKPFTPFNLQMSILGSSFMNCFINAAFSIDKMLLTDKGLHWICRHKEPLARMSATATLGLLCLWNLDGGLNKIDKFLYSKDEYIKAGALLAIGLVNCTIKSEFEPTFLLLKDYLSSKSQIIQIGSIFGLAMAYLGTNHSDVIESIVVHIKNLIDDQTKKDQWPLGLSAIACGLIGHSSGDLELINLFIDIIAKNGDNIKLSDWSTRSIVHAIGFVLINQKQQVSTILNLINQKIQCPNVKKYLLLCIDICVHIGSSNILKIQELIRNCTPIIMEQNIKIDDQNLNREPSTPKQPNQNAKTNQESQISDEQFIQMLSVVGIGLVSISDDLNSEMVFRTFIHFLKLGNKHLKSATILAIAITHLSDPKMNVIELIHKYCHSIDENVAINSIISLGLVCAGSNHSRVAKMLLDLNEFHRNKPNCLFAVKVSQGLLYLGKGLLTLCPQMEYRLLRQSSISSVLALILHLFDPKELIKQHYYLYLLTGAIRPKMLVTLDTEMNAISIPIRVGQSVDIIGQAGNPRSISGIQTTTTPVLLNKNDKAELATEQYIALNNLLQGFVIVTKNNSTNQADKEQK